MPQSHIKASGETLPYEIDFKALTNGVPGALTDFFEEGETIQSYTVEPDDGITLVSDDLVKSNTSVRLVIGGGTVHRTYHVTVAVSTTLGNIAERSITIRIPRRR